VCLCACVSITTVQGCDNAWDDVDTHTLTQSVGLPCVRGDAVLFTSVYKCMHTHTHTHTNTHTCILQTSLTQTRQCYRRRKCRMPYLYRSFSSKKSYNSWLFCGKRLSTLRYHMHLRCPVTRQYWLQVSGDAYDALKLRVSFSKRATNYRALLRKETYKDKAGRLAYKAGRLAYICIYVCTYTHAYMCTHTQSYTHTYDV